jgi:hypothetical protein
MPPYTRIKKLANIFRNLITYVQGELDLPDYHASVLLLIAHNPRVRLRDIAASLNITERSPFGITDLGGAGYAIKGRHLEVAGAGMSVG